MLPVNVHFLLKINVSLLKTLSSRAELLRADGHACGGTHHLHQIYDVRITTVYILTHYMYQTYSLAARAKRTTFRGCSAPSCTSSPRLSTVNERELETYETRKQKCS